MTSSVPMPGREDRARARRDHRRAHRRNLRHQREGFDLFRSRRRCRWGGVEEGQKAFAFMNPAPAHGRSGRDRRGGRLRASSDSSFMTASEVAVDGGLAQDLDAARRVSSQLRNYRLRQHRPSSGQGVRPKRHRSIRCDHTRPGQLCICCGRDRTRDHSHNTRGSGQGEHRFLAVRYESHRDVAKALPSLERKDDHRCDQCLRRVP